VKRSVSPNKPFGVNVYGYVHAESGVGQSARANIQALNIADVPISVIDFRQGNASRMLASIDETLKSDDRYQCNLFHINADQIRASLEFLGHHALDGHYNIGYWAWELPEFPDEWVEASHYLDEIWTPSAFCKEAFEKKLSIPVRVVPHSIWLENRNMPANEETVSASETDFTFLTMFDCHSIPERKNVFAVIEAFEKSFSPNGGQAKLIIKVSNLDSKNSFATRLNECVENNSDIALIAEYLERNDIFRLFDQASCFVSLHRSEGFGLGIAEAMLLGKPTIVTGWSGNMEFCNNENSLLVDYKLVQLSEDYGPYKKGQTWADPCIDHAALLMLSIYNDKDLYDKISKNGYRHVVEHLSPEVIGASLKDYLGDTLRHQ
jgi:glycosyltransferase involved in cell wall biosynthesis